MILRGKNVVITGASRGLGRALVARFAQEGARLAFCSRTWNDVNRVALELSLQGHAPIFASCDVADADQVAQFAERVLSEFGSVDVLINNAALLGQRAGIADWTLSAWERVMSVNVHGPFLVTKAFLPAMIRQRSGSIINVSSSVGKKGRSGWGAYEVSKFALEGFTETLAEEVRQFGVRVNSVNPGALDTGMRHAAYPDEDRSGLTNPMDVTEIFVYLASDRSRGITGEYVDAQEYLKTNKENS